MSHGGGGDSRKVVIAALAGNAAIATAKFVAAWLSGSVTMMAEGVHSLADTANQGLLLVGMKLAAKKDPIRFPMGRAKEIYFWSFIVSLLLFFLGGVFAIFEGVDRLRHGGHESHGVPIASLVVLVVSIAAEGGSFMVAFREFNKSRKGQTFFRALFGGKDPTIPLVLLEDTAAIVGLVVALVAVALSWLTGSSVVDSVGSILIGVLLCSVGVLLAKDTHALLIGEGITEEVRQEIVRVARAIDGVIDVTQVLSLHLGPDNVLVALKVRFPLDMVVADVERITNTLEEKLRAAHPELKRIFVEADSVYDPTKDSEYVG